MFNPLCYNLIMSEAPSVREARSRGAHPEKARTPDHGQMSAFDSIPQQSDISVSGSRPEPTLSNPGRLFKEGQIPEAVYVPTGTAYYATKDDIPTKSFPKREAPLKIDHIETRAAIALKICPPQASEAEDASVIVNERGIYVRVILNETDNQADATQKFLTMWIHYNEVDTQKRGPQRLHFT
jgi:hypothetical protein